MKSLRHVYQRYFDWCVTLSSRDSAYHVISSRLVLRDYSGFDMLWVLSNTTSKMTSLLTLTAYIYGPYARLSFLFSIF